MENNRLIIRSDLVTLEVGNFQINTPIHELPALVAPKYQSSTLNVLTVDEIPKKANYFVRRSLPNVGSEGHDHSEMRHAHSRRSTKNSQKYPFRRWTYSDSLNERQLMKHKDRHSLSYTFKVSARKHQGSNGRLRLGTLRQKYLRKTECPLLITSRRSRKALNRSTGTIEKHPSILDLDHVDCVYCGYGCEGDSPSRQKLGINSSTETVYVNVELIKAKILESFRKINSNIVKQIDSEKPKALKRFNEIRNSLNERLSQVGNLIFDIESTKNTKAINLHTGEIEQSPETGNPTVNYINLDDVKQTVEQSFINDNARVVKVTDADVEKINLESAKKRILECFEKDSENISSVTVSDRPQVNLHTIKEEIEACIRNSDNTFSKGIAFENFDMCENLIEIKNKLKEYGSIPNTLTKKRSEKALNLKTGEVEKIQNKGASDVYSLYYDIHSIINEILIYSEKGYSTTVFEINSIIDNGILKTVKTKLLDKAHKQYESTSSKKTINLSSGEMEEYPKKTDFPEEELPSSPTVSPYINIQAIKTNISSCKIDIVKCVSSRELELTKKLREEMNITTRTKTATSKEPASQKLINSTTGSLESLGRSVSNLELNDAVKIREIKDKLFAAANTIKPKHPLEKSIGRKRFKSLKASVADKINYSLCMPMPYNISGSLSLENIRSFGSRQRVKVFIDRIIENSLQFLILLDKRGLLEDGRPAPLALRDPRER